MWLLFERSAYFDFLQTGELWFCLYLGQPVKLQDSALVVRSFNSSCPEAFTPGQWRTLKDAFSIITVPKFQGLKYGPKL